MSLPELHAANLPALSDEEFRGLLAETLAITQEDRRQNALLYYAPVSAKVQAVHDSVARVIGVGGGNGSGKSDAALAELVMCATGIFPYSQRHLVERKFRGPIAARLVVESLTTTLEPIILPKLQWWRWSGVDAPGGARGHWGWVPKSCLVEGEWQRSWSAKLRLLRLICRDPSNPDRVLGESSIQCMSVDQDSTDFASGDFHLVVHDEPPSLAIWRENEARIMRVNGRLLLAMTWPDDPAIAVDWLYDEVYEPGRAGSDPAVAWFELWTTENPNLDQRAVAAQAERWSSEIASVRIYGRPIRFSNRVHAGFTASTKTWCFACGKSVVRVPGETLKPLCGVCGGEWVADYNHVAEFEHSGAWPTVFVIDPHSRKPHMFLWAQVDPSDDWWVVAEGKCEGDCVETRDEVYRVERELGLAVARRLMDPNFGASPAGQRREVTWQDEFAAAGLACELAEDADVGRSRINQMLRPDADTLAPRLRIHARCKDTVYQLERFVWDDFSRRVDRDLKQVPKDKHSDYPAMLRYLANSEPSFALLRHGAPVLRRPGQRKGAY